MRGIRERYHGFKSNGDIWAQVVIVINKIPSEMEVAPPYSCWHCWHGLHCWQGLHCWHGLHCWQGLHCWRCLYYSNCVFFHPCFWSFSTPGFRLFAPLLFVPPFLSSTVACQHSNDTYANLPTTILPLSGLAQLSIEKVTSVDVEWHDVCVWLMVCEILGS